MSIPELSKELEPHLVTFYFTSLAHLLGIRLPGVLQAVFPKFLLSTTASFMAVIKLTVIREGDV